MTCIVSCPTSLEHHVYRAIYRGERIPVKRVGRKTYFLVDADALVDNTDSVFESFDVKIKSFKSRRDALKSFASPPSRERALPW